MGPEARLESRCRALAARHGLPLLKLAPDPVGLPDRLLLFPTGKVRFIEFKALGGRLSPRQRYVHRWLAARGHPVAVIRGTSDFKKLLTDG